ncbi:hypothetical protein GALMADRAFT_148919 [Galerina marginata CBS 339.88]|uniref:Uncharacterized protein n=1 Tax=Galerina marginata (strain CBS 339.88) TaxID=685588 RepID=A0A067S2W9_GALM3|nr:hypothetical protein GALMADRAFT_148919 [Galerina marginata CBS 339.88]
MSFHPHILRIIYSNREAATDVSEFITNETSCNLTAMDALHSQMNEVNQQIHKLVENHKVLCNQLHVHKHNNYLLASLSKPYQKMPPEILSRIFFHTIPTDDCTSQLPEWYNTLQIFTQICRYWKNTATADSMLWKYLYINSSDWDDMSFAHHILKTWIYYMPHNNLHLRVRFPIFVEIPYGLNAFYDTLNDCLRLNDLTIILDEARSTDHAFILSRMNLPSLSSLSFLENDDNFTPSHYHAMNSTHIHAPNLSHITLKVTYYNVIDPINLQAITSLTLTVYTRYIADVIGILRHCHSLVTCNIALDFWTTSNGLQNIQSIILPALKKLQIVLHKSMPGLLTKIIAPNLTTLEILRLKPVTEPKVTSVKEFIVENKKVTSIKIAGFKVTSDQEELWQGIRSTHFNTNIVWVDMDIQPYESQKISVDNTSTVAEWSPTPPA